MKQIRVTGQCHTFQLTLEMLEEAMMQMLSESTASPARAVLDIFWKEITVSIFRQKFENVTVPYEVPEVHYRKSGDSIFAEVHSICNGERAVTFAQGNGSLNAVSNALKSAYGLDYSVVTYSEHALERSSSSRAIAYVGIESKRDGKMYWGAGVDADITHASVDALVTAINNSLNA